MTYVYFIQQGYGAIKIGVSDDPEARCAHLQTGTSKALRIIARFPFASKAEAFTVERELHAKYGYLRGRGEWFKPGLLRALRIGGRRVIGGTKKNPTGGWVEKASAGLGREA